MGKLMPTRPVLGVLGGSFNPPHIGHVLLPTYVLSRGLATRILVAPCWVHPFAKHLADFDTRMAMTRRAMSVHGPHVEVSTIERDIGRDRDGPSYTIDLLDCLAKKYPECAIRPIMGTDITAKGELKKWRGYERLMREFPPIIVPRAGYADRSLCALPEVSSTDIRTWAKAVAAGHADEQTRERLAAAVPKSVREMMLAPVKSHSEIWIVGRGHVAAHAHTWILDKGLRTRTLSARELMATRPTTPDIVPDAVWILCRDGDLPQVATGVSRLFGNRDRSKIPVLHAAGAIVAASARGLKNLRDDGHPVATLHPICSLRKECSEGMIADACFGVEGDPTARDFALSLVGHQPWLDLQTLDERQRLAYHGACALAANHLAVLWGRAAAVLEGQGHPRETIDEALRVLLHSSLRNLVELGIPRGITGPISRGDHAAVAKHLEVLDEQTAAVYRVLSQQLAKLVC